MNATRLLVASGSKIAGGNSDAAGDVASVPWVLCTVDEVFGQRVPGEYVAPLSTRNELPALAVIIVTIKVDGMCNNCGPHEKPLRVV